MCFSLSFSQPVLISKLEIRFQGGFSGKDNSTFVILNEELKLPIHPVDANTIQSFELPEVEIATEKVKIVFSGSTDFYGRIVIYNLNLYGKTK